MAPHLRVLVLGFGPFQDVRDNPASRLAHAVDGRLLGGVRLIGREMPVSYGRAVPLTVSLAHSERADVVLGVGVARGRTAVCVERVGHRTGWTETADVDGVAGARHLEELGSEAADTNSLGAEAWATVPCETLAGALGGVVSDDAGRYVCNAWLFGAVTALGATRPVGFVHVPDAGIDPDRFVVAVAAIWGAISGAGHEQR